VAQTLSYEIRLAFLFLVSAFVVIRIDLAQYARIQEGVWLVALVPVLGILWWVSSVAETNRRPFDFAERERELVSGFNVEYGGGLFAFMFIAEYARIIFMARLLRCIFAGWWLGHFSILVGALFFMLLFVWVRVSYPRTRYDKLMYLS
jgi:NADH-ubiquinone oxidoreductase chain 1